MFTLSSLMAPATQPLTAMLLLLAAAWLLARRRPRLSRALLGWGLAGTLLLGWVPLPNLLLRALESRVAPPAPPGDAAWGAYAGLVVLGGATDHALVRSGNGQVSLGDSAERLTMAVALARAHPGLRVVFAGGDGTLLGQPVTEADQARQFFTEMGLPAAQVQYESRSRTTYENAELAALLPGVDRQGRWLVVTSAVHMPRALAAFRAAGWNATPYPVDYRVGAELRWTEYAMARSLGRWQAALHELVGLLTYRTTGKA